MHDHGNCNRCDALSDERDTLKDVLRCDAEHGLVDQARDLVAERDSLRAQLTEAQRVPPMDADTEEALQSIASDNDWAHTTLRDAITSLRRRVAELEADRERLDWLLTGGGNAEVCSLVDGDACWHAVDTRAAIDAARGKDDA